MAKTKASTADSNTALYSEALRTLRERHNDEFREIIGGLYEAAGKTYRPRLTAEERAERERQRREDAYQAALERVNRQYADVAATDGQGDASDA